MTNLMIKIVMLATCSIALIAAFPVTPVVAAGGGKTLGLQHKVTKKNHSGISVYAPLREMPAKGSKNVYPRAFGYARGEVSDRETETSRQAGGGGGGGGSGM